MQAIPGIPTVAGRTHRCRAHVAELLTAERGSGTATARDGGGAARESPDDHDDDAGVATSSTTTVTSVKRRRGFSSVVHDVVKSQWRDSSYIPPKIERDDIGETSRTCVVHGVIWQS